MTQPLLSMTASCLCLSSPDPTPHVHLMIQAHQANVGPRTCQALSRLSAFARAVPSAENTTPTRLASWRPGYSLSLQKSSSDVTSPGKPSQTPADTAGQVSPTMHVCQWAAVFSVSFPTRLGGRAGLGHCHLPSPGPCTWHVPTQCLHRCGPLGTQGRLRVGVELGLQRAVMVGGRCPPLAGPGWGCPCLKNGWGGPLGLTTQKAAVTG